MGMGMGVVTREMLEAVAHVNANTLNGSEASSGNDAKAPRDDGLRAVVRPGRMLDRGRVGDDEVGILLSEVEPERVDWLWPGRIPKGKLTVLDGDPGLGKSAATVDLAARVSAGLELPDGTLCEAAGAVICSAEDGLADTIRPRLDAAGGDPSRVLSLATVTDGEGLERPLSIPQDVPIIEEGIGRVEAVLVVVDPLMAFFGGAVSVVAWQLQRGPTLDATLGESLLDEDLGHEIRHRSHLGSPSDRPTTPGIRAPRFRLAPLL